jgi:hypothetical protein
VRLVAELLLLPKTVPAGLLKAWLLLALLNNRSWFCEVVPAPVCCGREKSWAVPLSMTRPTYPCQSYVPPVALGELAVLLRPLTISPVSGAVPPELVGRDVLITP